MKRIPLGAAAATSCLFATWYSAICLAAFWTIIAASAAANAQTSAEGLNAAEQWVVDQVTSDKVADLDAALNADHTKKFPKEEDRRLRVRVLENLLTGTLPDVKRRHGVEIIGAIINEQIDLSNAHIACEVGLEDCQFNKSVSFERASFARDVSFGGSTFREVALFDRMTVGGDADFTKAVFKGRSSFNGADITGAFLASYAHFTATAEFFGLKVGQKNSAVAVKCA